MGKGMSIDMKRGVRSVFLVLGLGIAACTTPGGDAAKNDPIEPVNRYFFELNRFGDEMLLKPMATIYRGTVPSGVRDAVSNGLGNLRLPWTAANDALQGEWGRAGTAAARFAVNSTLGFFGLFDPAKDLNLKHHDEDFGQTLGVAGLPGDPYLVLPLFGPSSPRDAAGLVVDSLLDPFNVAARGRVGFKGNSNGLITARSVSTAIVAREKTLEALAELERGVDYYAAVRSAWRQKRAAEIRNTASTGTPVAPRFGAD
jgi:phospholipid-binding lipoprotein MlaA